MEALDLIDIFFETGEFFKLLLEVFELRVGRVELLEHLIDLLFPEPVELLEAFQELHHVVLGALD